jgi:hypothetical protein
MAAPTTDLAVHYAGGVKGQFFEGAHLVLQANIWCEQRTELLPMAGFVAPGGGCRSSGRWMLLLPASSVVASVGRWAPLLQSMWLLKGEAGLATSARGGRPCYNWPPDLLQFMTYTATSSWWSCYNGMAVMFTAATGIATTPHGSCYQSTPTWLPRHDVVATSGRGGCYTSWWSCYNGTTGCSGWPLMLPQHHIGAATMARCHCCKQQPRLCYHGVSAVAASPTSAASATSCRALR